MIDPFIQGRAALADASDLIDRFGDDAGFEAAARAERSRDNGNVVRFCHWRQIERVIATLADDEVRGTIHSVAAEAPVHTGAVHPCWLELAP